MDRISNATIVDNTLKDVEVGWPGGAPIFLWQSNDNNISDNHFEAVSGGSAGIRLQGGSSGNTLDDNHFVESGLPGWTANTPDGPGAILLDASTYYNTVLEMKIPPGKTLCQMIWDMTDDPETLEYDGANYIHNWQPCENLAELVVRRAEPESESGSFVATKKMVLLR
jgi:parallel beta-helix repeat protein